jgi:hypothetical protein
MLKQNGMHQYALKSYEVDIQGLKYTNLLLRSIISGHRKHLEIEL